jgi:hypothetical protein
MVIDSINLNWVAHIHTSECRYKDALIYVNMYTVTLM